jgi:hypothetical protein
MSEEGRGEREVSTSPFDEIPAGKGGKRVAHLTHIAVVLRILSGIALAFAFVSAARVILLDVGQLMRPEAAWRVNSALPLIGIGVSYALLQVTLPCTRAELWLSLAVSGAFISWGLEQYLPGWLATRIDDVVVFVFVVDLGIIIRGRLKRSFEEH